MLDSSVITLEKILSILRFQFPSNNNHKESRDLYILCFVREPRRGNIAFVHAALDLITLSHVEKYMLCALSELYASVTPSIEILTTR